MATEKKIIHVGYRLPESMALRIKGLAQAKGITESEFVRIACSSLIEKEISYITTVNSIFADLDQGINLFPVEPCSTQDTSQEQPPTAVR